VWTAATDGALVAVSLVDGHELWRTSLGAPVLASLAASGDWLVAATYDGTVHALVRGDRAAVVASSSCAVPAGRGGCCDAGGDPSGALWLAIAVVVVALRRRPRVDRIYTVPS
jgi:MYXO-CTERM domain-containing protein